MFWTDWGSDPRVEGANLQGEERFVVTSAGVNRPRGITCDYDNER